MKDFFKRPLAVGQTICWPCRSRSDLWLSSGVIKSVDPLVVVKQTPRGPVNVVIDRTDRVVLGPSFSLLV